MTPSPTMRKALNLARLDGALRRLPGGYWVRDLYPRVEAGHVPETYVATGTVQACRDRGWLSWEDGGRVRLTDAGRALVA